MFVEVTVTRNEVLAVREPSDTVIVTVLEPDCPVAGVMVTVRFVELPPKTMPEVGRSVVFEEAFVRVSLLAAVLESLILKGIAVDEVFNDRVNGAIGVMVGG